MKINNVELPDLDIYDLEFAEKYENGLKKIENLNDEGLGYSEVIRNSCNLVFDFFNDIFGPGTDKKLFGNKTNLMVCAESLKEFIANVEEQKKKANLFISEFSQKHENRYQRRHNKRRR